MWPAKPKPLPRLSVLIPLHRAGPWVDDISTNLSLVPADARVVLSDETLADNALDQLRQRHGHDPRIEFRARVRRSGWRLHANRLLAAGRTERIALLAQDDRITPGFYEKQMEALDRIPAAGLAFGVIEAVGLAGRPPTRFPGPPFPLGQRPPWREAIDLDRDWNLGIPYRGVVRRRLVRPIPAVPGDRFADQIWVFGLALAARLVEVPDALYIKRYHPDNTHMAWSPLSAEERRTALQAQVRQRLRHDRAARRAALEAVGRGGPKYET